MSDHQEFEQHGFDQHEFEHNDEFEATARAAGAALRRPAPADGVQQVQHARRRRQMVRGAVVGVVALVAVVVIVVTRPSPKSVTPAGPDDTTTTTQAATTTTTPALSLPYTLNGLSGLTPLVGIVRDDSMLTPGYYTLVWAGTGGVTESFVVLHEEPTDQLTIECSTDPCETLVVPTGEAKMLTYATTDGQPHFEIVWVHDGVLWTIRQYGLTAPQLQAAVLAIVPGSGLPYVLPLDGYTYLGLVGSWESMYSLMSLDGLPLTLAVTSGGLAQQLSLDSYEAVSERTIAGVAGYELTLVGGGTRLTWPVPVKPTDSSNDRWMSVMIPKELAGRVDEVVAAITPVTPTTPVTTG